ncbi:MAG: hypothetical protein DLM59_18480 [Pseudonocardiales bacterium]|nr:MAG: hypothetical protein DLM59_18480 [Pseudonocardiales bacterium]
MARRRRRGPPTRGHHARPTRRSPPRCSGATRGGRATGRSPSSPRRRRWRPRAARPRRAADPARSG